jgi:hypothetical protein
MARGHVQQPILSQQFELAEAFHTVWRLADAKLREDIERVVRAYAQRQPCFEPFSRIATTSYTPLFSFATNEKFELAAALHTVWQLADTTLRMEVDQIIRAFVQRHPEYRHRLQAIRA